MAESQAIRNSSRTIEPRESPFGVGLFDCRMDDNPAKLLFTDEHKALRAQRQLSDGHEFYRPRKPSPFALICHIEFPQAEERPVLEGPLFVPKHEDDAWFIYHYQGELMFLHWLDADCSYRAHIVRKRDRIIVEYVNYFATGLVNSAAYHLGVVDYLIKAYLYNKFVPHPMPACAVPSDPESICTLSFFYFGRRGLFATSEDTIHLPWLDVDVRSLLSRKPRPL